MVSKQTIVQIAIDTVFTLRHPWFWVDRRCLFEHAQRLFFNQNSFNR